MSILTDSLKSVFDFALENDKRTITMFTSGETYDVFFRIYNDNRSPRSVMVMYYLPENDEISAGKIFSMEDVNENTEYFIILNAETSENEVYRKSTVVKTNAMVSNPQRTFFIPMYVDAPVTNANKTWQDNYASYTDGDCTGYCEQDNPIVKTLKISDKVTFFARQWEITNIFMVDGVANFIFEVTEEEVVSQSDSFTGVFIGLDATINKNIGDYETLDFRVYNNGAQVQYADVFYTSSNPSIATVDPRTGKINYIAEGSFKVICSCMNIDFIKETPTITVKTGEDTRGYSIFFAPETELYPVVDNIINVYLAHGGKVDTTNALSYKIENNDFNNQYLSDIVITPINTGGIKVVVKGSRIKPGNSFDIVAYNASLSLSARKTYTIQRI